MAHVFLGLQVNVAIHRQSQQLVALKRINKQAVRVCVFGFRCTQRTSRGGATKVTEHAQACGTTASTCMTDQLTSLDFLSEKKHTGRIHWTECDIPVRTSIKFAILRMHMFMLYI